MKSYITAVLLFVFQIISAQTKPVPEQKKKYVFGKELFGNVKTYRFNVSVPHPSNDNSFDLMMIAPFGGEYFLGWWFRMDFDKNGNIQSETKLQSRVTYEYDTQNREIENLRYDTISGIEKKRVLNRTTYAGDRIIRKENIQNFDPECPFQVYAYAYDAAGNKISTFISSYLCNQSRTVPYSVIKILDEYKANKLVRETVFQQGELASSSDYTYDANGRQAVMMYQSYSKNYGKVVLDSSFYDARGNQTRDIKHVVGSSSLTETIVRYDEKNRLTESMYRSDDELDQHKYVYDNAGRMISESQRKTRGRVDLFARVDYTFDAKGNIIEAVMYNAKNYALRRLTAKIEYY